MPILIEQREYEAPEWEEFDWNIQGQRVKGFFSELEASTELLKKIRIVLPIPRDSENVSIAIQERRIVERDSKEPGRGAREIVVETYVISYWSPDLQVGRLVTIPRELAMRRDDNGPTFIQIEQVDLCGYNLRHEPMLGSLT